MKQKGMGATRLGRFAAVTVPATVMTAGLGLAITQGMVGAALASATSFTVAGTQATGDAMELSANYTSGATADGDNTAQNKKDALVSLKNGAVTDMCLAADTAVPVIGTLGLTIQSLGSTTSLGAGYTDLAADSLNGSSATLGETKIGYAQSDLVHQSGMLPADNPGYAEGGFSLETSDAPGSVDIADLDAKVYALTLSGLSLQNLAIAATTGSVENTAC